MCTWRENFFLLYTPDIVATRRGYLHIMTLVYTQWPRQVFLTTLYMTWYPSQYRDDPFRYGDSIIKIRRSWDSLISMKRIPILIRQHLYIETGPMWLNMLYILLYVILSKCQRRQIIYRHIFPISEKAQSVVWGLGHLANVISRTNTATEFTSQPSGHIGVD